MTDKLAIADSVTRLPLTLHAPVNRVQMGRLVVRTERWDELTMLGGCPTEAHDPTLRIASAIKRRKSQRLGVKASMVTAFVAFALGGCGGGGSGPAPSPGPGGNTAQGTLTLTPASFQASTQVNFGAVIQRFTAEIQPPPNDVFFVRTAVTGTAVDYVNLSMSSDARTAFVGVALKEPSLLGVGEYDGAVEVTACADSACTNKYGSKTIPVHYQITPSGFPPESGGLPTQMIPIPANDVVWDDRHQRLYFSVPSSAGPSGNVILALDPTSGDFTTQDAGSEPNVLSISDDGQYLYAGIDGASSIQRFSLPDLVPDLKISLGADPDGFYGPFYPHDLKVAPGNPQTLAVSLARRDGFPLTVGGLAIFDAGVKRPAVAPGDRGSVYDSIQWGSSSATLYAANNTSVGQFNPLYALAASAGGVVETASYPDSFSRPIHYDPATSYVYGDEGRVVDPATGSLITTFDVYAPNAMVPDSSTNTAFFQGDDPSGQGYALHTFDLTSFVSKSLAHLDNMGFPAQRLVRWGASGNAFVTNGGPAFLTGGHSLSQAFDTSTPVASAAVGFLPLPANDMVWDPLHGLLYVSVRSDAPQHAGSIVAINPDNGTIVSSLNVGNDPDFLAISDDQQFLYVGLDASSQVLRLNLPQLTRDVTIPLGSDGNTGDPYYALDMKVAPGAPRTLAVSLGDARSIPPAVGGLVIFDDATPRPARAPGASTLNGGSYDSIQWGSDASTLYAANNQSSSFDLYVLRVNSNGVSPLRKFAQITSPYTRITFDRGNGLIYEDNGYVVSPVTGLPVGRFLAGGKIVPDSGLNRIFFATNATNPPGGDLRLVIRSFDAKRYRPLAQISIIDLPSDNFHTRLVRWGSDGLALSKIGGLYIIRGSFVNSN